MKSTTPLKDTQEMKGEQKYCPICGIRHRPNCWVVEKKECPHRWIVSKCHKCKERVTVCDTIDCNQNYKSHAEYCIPPQPKDLTTPSETINKSASKSGKLFNNQAKVNLTQKDEGEWELEFDEKFYYPKMGDWALGRNEVTMTVKEAKDYIKSLLASSQNSFRRKVEDAFIRENISVDIVNKLADDEMIKVGFDAHDDYEDITEKIDEVIRAKLKNIR